MKVSIIMTVAGLFCYMTDASPVMTGGVLGIAVLLSIGSLLTWIIE